MPNYVKHLMTFGGDPNEIKKLTDSILTQKPDSVNYFDFNKVIPLPESLQIESGTLSEMGEAVAKFLDEGDDTLLMDAATWKKYEHPQQFIDYLKEDSQLEKYLNIGRICIENRKKYGHADWYNWCIDNWGTKWNSCDSRCDEYDSITFETAWSSPYNVIKKLSEKFPTITINVKYADEDIGNNCGEYEFLNGEEIVFRDLDPHEICELWGLDVKEFFPEIYRDDRINDLLKNDNNNSSL